MRDDEFEARLIEWLDMSGEGDLYTPTTPTPTRRIPATPASMPCAPST